MIERWFEDFTLLLDERFPDGCGGQQAYFTPGADFRGALTFAAGSETSAAGQFLLEENPVLLHEFDVTLSPGDRFRRKKDGAVYRVCGRSDNMRTPAFSGLRFAQVPVERVVIPC